MLQSEDLKFLRDWKCIYILFNNYDYYVFTFISLPILPIVYITLKILTDILSFLKHLSILFLCKAND